MHRRGGFGLVALALVAGWGWLAFRSTQPPDRHEARVSMVEVAQDAYDALRTAGLTATALLQRRAPGPYVSAVLDDATERLASAAKEYAKLAPADGSTARMRDELAPLLAAAVPRLGDLQRASADDDVAALQAAVEALDPLAQQLGDFVDRYG